MKNADTRKNSSRAQIGDVVEIATPAGFGYVQFTYDQGNNGQLVRVLPGLYESRPADIAALTREKELYFIFYLMEYPLRRGLAVVVANASVPEWAATPPMMRLAVTRDYDLGRVLSWRIVSAANQLTLPELLLAPPVTQLTPEQERLSIRVIRPHSVMVRELALGWTPERAAEFDAKAAAIRNEEKRLGIAPQIDKLMRHYLYFSSSVVADEAGEHLRELGFETAVEPGPDDEKWLVLARKLPPSTADEMAKLRDELETLAIRFGGEYDGWEMALDQAKQSGLVS